jgi:hypothetical protein
VRVAQPSPIMVNVAAFHDGPVDRIQREEWVNDFSATLDQGDAGAYVNFIGCEGDDRIPPGQHLGSTRSRQGVVRPDEPVRLNHNIPP